MLKSLLLDRMKRKRSSSIEADLNSKKSNSSNIQKVSKPMAIPEQPQDILRKRLLGWVDPPPPASKESPKHDDLSTPSDPRRSQEQSSPAQPNPVGQNPNQNYGQVFQIDLNQTDEESAKGSLTQNSTARVAATPPSRPELENNNNSGDKTSAKKEKSGGKKEKELTYANTSVLKHLLHRYTETNQ
jgi:hypothetical protein